MEFLYGDSTPSPLTSNFLEFLRDALDFSVFVVGADDNIRLIRERMQRSAEAADEETRRLEAFGRAVAAAIEEAPTGDASSESSRCALQVAGAVSAVVRASVDHVRDELASKQATADEEEAAERDACYQALDKLLLPHPPPGASASIHIARCDDGSYVAYSLNEVSFGLTWRIDLAIPPDHVLATPAPLDRLVPQLEFSVPEQTGWIKKEVKLRPQRLERHVLVEASDDGTTIGLKLRAEGSMDRGVDFSIDTASSAVGASRVGPSDDPSIGRFEPLADDVAKLVALGEKLRGVIAGIKGSRLAEATLDGTPFKDCPTFAVAAERLVALLAPIVQEISRHSVTQTELVIRRLLSSERREEIFIAKSTLREKYAPLPVEGRALFGPLGLDTLPPPPPEATPAGEDAPRAAPVVELSPDDLRTELPSSLPPPARTSSLPPRSS